MVGLLGKRRAVLWKPWRSLHFRFRILSTLVATNQCPTEENGGVTGSTLATTNGRQGGTPAGVGYLFNLFAIQAEGGSLKVALEVLVHFEAVVHPPSAAGGLRRAGERL